MPLFSCFQSSTIPSAKAQHLQQQQPYDSTTSSSTALFDPLTAHYTDFSSNTTTPTTSASLLEAPLQIDLTNCLQCPLCLKEFKVLGSLKRHYRSHINFKPYVCDICGKRFTLNQYLIEHRRTHTGERPYTCHVCGKSFAQTGTLYHHVKNVHQISWVSSDKPVPDHKYT